MKKSPKTKINVFFMLSNLPSSFRYNHLRAQPMKLIPQIKVFQLNFWLVRFTRVIRISPSGSIHCRRDLLLRLLLSLLQQLSLGLKKQLLLSDCLLRVDASIQTSRFVQCVQNFWSGVEIWSFLSFFE